MTWKPTEEMENTTAKAYHIATIYRWEAALIAVQPLIAEEERERIAKHWEGMGAPNLARDIRSLIPKPPGET